MIKVFTLEDGRKLELSEQALKHIIDGDITTKPVNRIAISILKGGLHTSAGWQKFKNKHPKLAHIHRFDSNIHKYWYYARELKNEVITLKIPIELFGGKAARNTMGPDDFYKSGYLWKTLFPVGYKEQDILNATEEALSNLNKKESTKNQLVGYANFEDPLKTMKITIQCSGTKINSIYPSWTQPNTGNTGKAYSHFDSIGHVIAESTVYFDGNIPLENGDDLFSTALRKNPLSLKDHMPEVFLARSIPSGSRLAWETKRDLELHKVSMSYTGKNVEAIVNYLTSFEICKNGTIWSLLAYEQEAKLIKSNLQVFNTFHINQNVIDGLKLLANYDNRHKTMHFSFAMNYLMLNMVTVGFIDSLLKRRVYRCIAQICLSYHCPSVIPAFLNLFSRSPTRREWMTEFSPSTLVKKKLKPTTADGYPAELNLIEIPNLDISITYNDLIEFIKENIGETYLLHFDDSYRDEFIRQLIEEDSESVKKAYEDLLLFVNVSDLSQFTVPFGSMINKLIQQKMTSDLSDPIRSILRDYCRIQFAQRFRINLLYKEFADFDIYPPDTIDQDYISRTILKHERWMNTFRLEEFIATMKKFAVHSKDLKLKNEATKFEELIGKEVPPLPEPVPNYILNKVKNRYSTLS